MKIMRPALIGLSSGTIGALAVGGWRGYLVTVSIVMIVFVIVWTVEDGRNNG